MMTCFLVITSLRHFRAIPEAALLPENAFISNALILSAIWSFSHSEDSSSAQDNHSKSATDNL